MIFNESLELTLTKTKEKSLDAHRQIEEFIKASPIEKLYHSSLNNAVTIESAGEYRGEFGLWNIIGSVDEFNNLDSIRIIFIGERTSRKPYTDKTSLSLSGIANIKSFFGARKIGLVDFSTERTRNYRFVDLERTSLTSFDIKEMSEPETISKFTLSAVKNFRTGKYSLVSNEVVGTSSSAIEIESDAIEA